MAKDKRRDLRSYRDAVARMKYRAKHSDKPTPCWFCKHPIDLTLDPSSKWAFTAHHLEPLATGGHINGTLVPAHRACNSSYGTGKKVDPFPTSRQW